jgi:hypothetical protein
MRKASQNYRLLIVNNVFIGIALGYDYCSEHEWGIKDLKITCGIPDSNKNNMGIKCRTITKAPDIIFKEEKCKKKKFAILYTGFRFRSQEDSEKYVPRDLENYKESLIWKEKWNNEHPNKESKDNIITAWDDSSFGIAVMGEKEVEYLKELKTAIETLNLTIAITSLKAINPFAGSSLCLLISNRIPQELIDDMYNADREYYDLEDYEEKIGMKKIIEKYNNKNEYKGLHYFMACSPKWISYNDTEYREEYKKKLNTEYNIIYWINYSDDDNNCGWYTVEQIREWLTGNKKLTKVVSKKEM